MKEEVIRDEKLWYFQVPRGYVFFEEIEILLFKEGCSAVDRDRFYETSMDSKVLEGRSAD